MNRIHLFGKYNYLCESFVTEAVDNNISKIQAALKAQGYGADLGDSGQNGDGIDGIIGPKTVAAIKKFQKANGIAMTGFVGKLTAPKLGVQPMKNTPKLRPSQVATTKKPQLSPIDLTPKIPIATIDTMQPYANNPKNQRDRMAFLMKDTNLILTNVNKTNKVKVTPQEFEHGTWFSKFISGSMKLLPLHLRAMVYYLGGRLSAMHSDELSQEERDYLYNVAKTYGLKQGFDYPIWKKIGAADLPTAVTSQGIQAETAKLKQQGSGNIVAPNMAGQFMYTVGAVSKSNITIVGTTITVKDRYDMNVVEAGTKRDAIFAGIADTFGLWTAGKASLYSLFRKTISLREILGYPGYPINFVLPAPAGKAIAQAEPDPTAAPTTPETIPTA